jgi:hypothetical protein
VEWDRWEGFLAGAASSPAPHGACGVGGANFSQSCTGLNAATAGSRPGNHLGQKACKSIRELGFLMCHGRQSQSIGQRLGRFSGMHREKVM